MATSIVLLHHAADLFAPMAPWQVTWFLAAVALVRLAGEDDTAMFKILVLVYTVDMGGYAKQSSVLNFTSVSVTQRQVKAVGHLLPCILLQVFLPPWRYRLYWLPVMFANMATVRCGASKFVH